MQKTGSGLSQLLNSIFFSRRAKAFFFLLLFACQSIAVQSSSSNDADPELRDFLANTIKDAGSFEDRFDAEVWLVAMSSPLNRFIPDQNAQLKLLRAIHREATLANLQPDLVLALIEIESSFDRFAVSRVGAQGLMQVMPFWKNEIGRPEDNLTDVNTNLRYGCRILQYYIKKENGHIARALARYNGSVGKTWYAEKVMTVWQRHWLAGAL
jgi:soluble lytic murein transglycosylase-like protein